MAFRHLSVVLLLAGCSSSSSSPTDLAYDDLGMPDQAMGGVDSATDMTPPVLAVPHLIAPLSTSTVTQRQPTLRWVLSAGAGTPVVDLCRDRGCTQLLGTTATLAGNQLSAVPAAALPSGWVFWRVRVVFGNETTTSATWQFWVGKISASSAVDSCSGTFLDVNGDGLVDLLVGAQGAGSQAGAANLYLNNGNGFSRIDLTNLDGAAANFGYWLASAGDVNGDGYADFVIGALSALSGAGSAHLYLGSATPSASDWNGPSPAPHRVDLASPDGAGSLFGIAVAGLGDVNGDGFGDFLVGTQGGKLAHLYLGEASPTGADWNAPSPAPKRIDLSDPTAGGSNFGWVAGAGDVNGDGLADFLVGAQNASSNAGAAYLYLGETTPNASDWNAPSPAPKRIDLFDPDGVAASFGDAVSSAGDVNGDGYADFLVGASGKNAKAGAAHLYLGEATPSSSDWNGPSPAPKRIDLSDPDGPGAQFGLALATAADVNGDGYADFLISANLTSGNGAAHLYLGEAAPTSGHWNGPSPAPKRIDLAEPDGASASFGVSMAAAGDVNGDGYGDFLIGAQTAHAGAGEFSLYSGEPSPTGADWNAPSPSPARTDFSNPDGPGAEFGVSVSSVEIDTPALWCAASSHLDAVALFARLHVEGDEVIAEQQQELVVDEHAAAKAVLVVGGKGPAPQARTGLVDAVDHRLFATSAGRLVVDQKGARRRRSEKRLAGVGIGEEARLQEGLRRRRRKLAAPLAARALAQLVLGTEGLSDEQPFALGRAARIK